jgi:hypothetical protein
MKSPAKTAMKFVSKLPSGEKPFLGFKLYTPAVIAFVGYIVLALTILLPFEYPIYDEVNDSVYIVTYDVGQRILMLLLMSIPIALSVYTINCMMAGKCVMWSYVVSIVTLIWIALFVVTAMYYTFSKKNEKFAESKKVPSTSDMARDTLKATMHNIIPNNMMGSK